MLSKGLYSASRAPRHGCTAEEVEFTRESVPAPLANRPAQTGVYRQADELLTRLFAERGVWSMTALCARTSQNLLYAVRRLVAGHAYRFVTGPWRRLWVRRGLDPRTDPSTRCMQMIEFRMPTQWCACSPNPSTCAAAGVRLRPAIPTVSVIA